jgi:serine/threonine-protein kinase
MISPAESKPVLEKYELAEEIGHGGMATVYRARDKRLERDVAIKVIHRHLRENKEVETRFASEARAVAKVKHPNIVEVYDVSGDEEEERYLVVELVRGTTLRKLLQEHGHMPAEVAAALALEVAAGLQHAHEQGVIHRDIKPENVLVDPPRSDSGARSSQERSLESRSAHVKITDFGIAKLLDAQGVTSTGQVLGSPAHMAPEQIEGGDVSARSDVFGLGVLIYECMVGRLPFDGKNPAQVLRRVLDGAFTVPDRARPSIGSAYSHIIEKALANDMVDRWESADELADALRAELARLGFDDPRRELAEYLSDPKAYWEAYEPRVVERLTERARSARRERNVQLAAADFNRALAFRPDSAELLADVAGLARRERLQRHLRRAGVVAGIGVVVGVAAYAAGSAYKRRVAEREAARAEAAAGAHAPKAGLKPETMAKVSIEPEPPREAHARRKHTPPPPQPRVMSSEPQTRPVRIVILGVKSTKVQIDGQPPQEVAFNNPNLTVGRHVLTFKPPNNDCCIVPPDMVVDIPAGNGAFPVTATVSFRPAIIRLNGGPGTSLSCGALGKLPEPSDLQVKVSSALTEGDCTVFPPAGTGEPRTKHVELKPGVIETLGYP